MVVSFISSMNCRAATSLTFALSAHSKSVDRHVISIKSHKLRSKPRIIRANEDSAPSISNDTQLQPTPTPSVSQEEVFYEGSGSNAELAISMLLGATLVYLPLSLASLGRRLWISYKFTNKRIVVITNSPVMKREVQIEITKIKEVRTAPRAFGAWGDMVLFLKDGSRLELVGLENFRAIQDYIEGLID
jgi:hypothetical protein